MVKLVRLTSNDNCKFNADLDAGINVEEKTQIAVQNLTAQTIFPTLNITPDNHIVRSNLDTTQYSHITSKLLTKQYTSANHNEFFLDLEQTLNDTMRTSAQAATPVQQTTIDNGGDVFRSVEIEYPDKSSESNDLVELEMRYTPVINPWVYNENLAPRYDEDGTTIFNHFGDVQVLTTSDVLYNISNLHQDGAATDGRTNFFAPIADDMMLSRGSGIWECRLQNLVDNTGAANTNGYAIGLSFTRTTNLATEIANNTRDFELRVKRPTDNYVYITPDNPYTEIDTGLAPASYTYYSSNPGPANDNMVFWKNGTKLHIQVWNNLGAVSGKVAFEHIYTLSKADAQKPLYPYIYICGNSSNAGDTQATDNIIGQPLLTIDPFVNGNNDYGITGQVQNINGTSNNWFDLVGGVGLSKEAVIPLLDNNRFERTQIMTNYQWRMDAEVWRQLGFSTGSTVQGHYDFKPIPNVTAGEDEGVNQFLRILLQAKNIYALVLSDNFIVVLDSNPVFSYDASRFDYGSAITAPSASNIHRGRRQNILATIPVNDNNGILEFRANELVYIDLDNRFPQTLKNLRLRVLNKNFDEIQTTGLSVMTLLIKG